MDIYQEVADSNPTKCFKSPDFKNLSMNFFSPLHYALSIILVSESVVLSD